MAFFTEKEDHEKKVKIDSYYTYVSRDRTTHACLHPDRKAFKVYSFKERAKNFTRGVNEQLRAKELVRAKATFLLLDCYGPTD